MALEYIEQRNRDLFEAFKRIIDDTPFPIRLKDVLPRTVCQPAKKFYISSRNAMEMVVRLRNGEIIDMTPERSRLFRNIMDLVAEQELKKPGTPLRNIIEEVIDMPAPEFYLKPSSAKIILHYERKKQKYLQQSQIRDRYDRIRNRKLAKI